MALVLAASEAECGPECECADTESGDTEPALGPCSVWSVSGKGKSVTPPYELKHEAANGVGCGSNISATFELL